MKLQETEKVTSKEEIRESLEFGAVTGAVASSQSVDSMQKLESEGGALLYTPPPIAAPV